MKYPREYLPKYGTPHISNNMDQTSKCKRLIAIMNAFKEEK